MNNPLLELFNAVGGEREDPVVDKVRAWACRHYSWAVPNEEAIAEIASYRDIVEMGAGLGYWAKLIVDYCQENVQYVRINCFDWGKQGEGNKWGRPWFMIYKGEPRHCICRNRIAMQCALFMCWPPRAKDSPMVRECLDLYRGNTILYIGEYNGTNGWDERLETEWMVEKKVEIPCWHGLHDALHVFKRKA